MHRALAGDGEQTVAVAVDFTESTPDDPATFDVRITVGAALSDESQDRLLTIAGKCPVHKALKAQDVAIHDSLQLIEDFEDED